MYTCTSRSRRKFLSSCRWETEPRGGARRPWDKKGTRESRDCRILSRLAGAATLLKRSANNSRFEEQRRRRPRRCLRCLRRLRRRRRRVSPSSRAKRVEARRQQRSEVTSRKSFAITHNGSRRVWRIVNQLTLSQLSSLANERANQGETRKRKRERRRN